MSDDLYRPDFDFGEFRYSVARYVKYLIRARWKWDAEFLSDAQLTRWDLNNIRRDEHQAWQLLEMAAATLAILNTKFLPRCGSGGVIVNDDDTPVFRGDGGGIFESCCRCAHLHPTILGSLIPCR